MPETERSVRAPPGGALACLLALALPLATACASAPGPDASGLVALGSAPLCEASATTRAPWDPELVLVADNEIGDRLFAFRVGRSGLLEAHGEVAVVGDLAPDDVEALAASGDHVVLVGSHGRNRFCERRPEKERMLVAAWTGDALAAVAMRDDATRFDGAFTDATSCLASLFPDPPPALAAELCQAAAAQAARMSSERCVPPFDIEAAAAEPGGERVWVGLRQPRVAGRPALLRLREGSDGPPFDAVALLAADDRGLRALTAHGPDLWAVLGPGAPDFSSSQVWRFHGSDLAPGATVAGEVALDRLPPASEGLVIAGGAAIVVVDGEDGSRPGVCREPARQLRRPLRGAARPALQGAATRAHRTSLTSDRSPR